MELIVTSDFRSKPIHDKDPGIHGTNPLRAIDLRSWTMRNPELIEEKINKAWIYDTDRPQYNVCVYHESKRTQPDGTIKDLGFHFHLQVHDNTTLCVNNPHPQTRSTFPKNLNATANTMNPITTFTTFNQPPDFGNLAKY